MIKGIRGRHAGIRGRHAGSVLLALTCAATATAPPSAQAQDTAKADAPAPAPVAPALPWHAALAHFAAEPSVQEVVERLRGGPREALAIRRSVARARRSGWAPTLRLRAQHGQGQDLGTYLYPDSNRQNASSDRDLTLEAALWFRLDRLVYHSDETAWSRLQRSVVDSRRTRIEHAIKLYFERRRLQLEEVLAATPNALRRLRILELQAMLDELTGQQLRRRWVTAFELR